MSRDRGGEYAAAARKGAPQAKPIADKFHIVKNLREGLKELMARKQKVLPEGEAISSDSIPIRARGKLLESAGPEVPQPDEPEKHWRSMSKEPRQTSAGQTSQMSASLGARFLVPIARLAMRPFERSISRQSPSGKLLAA